MAEDNDSLLDFGHMLRLGGFVLRSLRRHATMALAIAGIVTAVTIAAAILAPRTYHVDTRILAQRNLVMSNLGNPRRAVPNEADTPTKSAAETILKRDNLVALIKQVNLMDEWRNTRAPILVARDWIVQLIAGEESEEDRLEALVGLLAKRIQVKTEEGTVNIGLDWPDGTLAYRIVSAAQQNFLEVRHAEEVSSIAETITILEGHAASIRENIEAAIAEMDRPPPPPSADPNAAQKAAQKKAAQAQSNALDRERGQLRTMIYAKRKAIADLEEFRNRRVAELNAQLAEQLSIYAEQHPAVQNTKATIASLSTESPQIKALRQQERELLEDYNKKGGAALPSGADEPVKEAHPAAVTVAAGDGAAPARPAAVPMRALSEQAQNYQAARIRVAMGSYEDISERIEAARIELDTTRAAFKYRYSIVTPPMVPKDPEKPNVAMILTTGAIMALLLALAAAALRDIAGGRLLESWQVAQRLKLPVLAELKEPGA